MVKIVDLVGGFQVSQQDIVVQRGRVFGGQRVDVLLGEEEMAEIEQLEIGCEKFARDFVVQRLMGVMAFFQEPSDGEADLLRIGFA